MKHFVIYYPVRNYFFYYNKIPFGATRGVLVVDLCYVLTMGFLCGTLCCYFEIIHSVCRYSILGLQVHRMWARVTLLGSLIFICWIESLLGL